MEKAGNFVMTAKELIRQSGFALERNNQSSTNVGNRPHYPMLLLFNNSFSQEDYSEIYSKLERVWPQTLEYLVSFAYSVTTSSDEISLFSLPGKSVVTVQELSANLDEVKTARGVFSSMRQWCVYNIIHTGEFSTVDEFIAHYQAIVQFRKIVMDAELSMVIVLLDDSALKRNVARDIRTFLSTAAVYDASIVISNRSRTNEMHTIDELLRIVSDVVLLSNNDAVSHVDDMDYKKRVSVLYSSSVYTVSYILSERPSKKIAIQILDVILQAALKYSKTNQANDLKAWSKGLGFENGRCKVCEEFLRGQQFQIDRNVFEFLPLRNTTLNERTRLAELPYAKLKQLTFDDAMDYLAGQYGADAQVKAVDESRCIEQFYDEVRKQFTLTTFRHLTDEMAENIVGQLDPGSVNDSEQLAVYFDKRMKVYLRQELIYPGMKSALIDLRRQAEYTWKELERVNRDFQKTIPLNLSDEIGSLYENAVNSYLLSDGGRRFLAKICFPGNSYEDILGEMFVCFQDFVRHNDELFSLPLIEEWARRLNLTGELIYKEISDTLTRGADDMILLYGNYPLDKRLKVYMLHSTDANGNNPTKLFQSVERTFSGDELVQYFNTGYDDALEGITFVSCAGINLLL